MSVRPETVAAYQRVLQAEFGLVELPATYVEACHDGDDSYDVLVVPLVRSDWPSKKLVATIERVHDAVEAEGPRSGGVAFQFDWRG